MCEKGTFSQIWSQLIGVVPLTRVRGNLCIFTVATFFLGLMNCSFQPLPAQMASTGQLNKGPQGEEALALLRKVGLHSQKDPLVVSLTKDDNG